MIRKTWVLSLVGFLSFPFWLYGGTVATYRFSATTPPRPGLSGNGITDLYGNGPYLWIGTGNGLSRLTLSTRSFETFGPQQGLGHGSVAAIWAHGDTVIVATATDTVTKVQATPLPKGTGLSFSFDGGANWRHVAQPGPTPVQNLTYDIAVWRGVVWITSWGGGVMKSADWGASWQEAPPDSFNFDPYGKLNHRGFSAVSSGDALWVGTAGGINKSADGGLTWKNFNATNQPKPISGNFVVALGHQEHAGEEVIWAATWKAEDENESYAVSRSRDGGLSWRTCLRDEKAHNFAFFDSLAYVATDNGLFVSDDYGETWYRFPEMVDVARDVRIYSNEIYSAYADEGALWVGTADGLAHTSTNGYWWDIFRAFVPTGKEGEKRTYAYPNPFSPMRHNQLGGDGFVRFQYNTRGAARVTVKVFDFAMDLVKTVVEDKFLAAAGDYAEVWSGRNDYGDAVANGVYFYSVEIDGDGTYWGKVLIVN